MERNGHPEPQPKRRRIGYACDFCRNKKMRCDGERPTCGACQSRHHECVYSPQRTRVSVTQDYVEGLKARNRLLEEKLASRSSRAEQSSPYPDEPRSNFSPSVAGPDAPYDAESGPVLPPTSHEPLMATNSGTPEGHLPADRDQRAHRLSYVGPRLSVFHSQSSHETHSTSNTATENDKTSPAEYYGESSAFNFIAKVTSPDQADTGATRDGDVGTPAPHRRDPLRHGPAEKQTPFLAASSPSTIVFEDMLGIRGAGSSPFELPQRQLADKLVTSFFYHRHILNPYLHEGTFRQRYERLWMSEDAGGEEPTSGNVVWLGLVNMVFAFGSEHIALRPLPTSTSSLPASATDWGWQRSSTERDSERFFRRAKTLILSGILQTGKIELVQALLLLGHFLHTSLELNYCWTVVGLAVRTAQELGLYLDPAQSTTDVVEQEIRKRVWWGCFAFDRLISTKLGRPPVIHDGLHISVDLPLPVDDEYLTEHAGHRQPNGVPSKLEYFRVIVSHCRLVERVLNGLFTNGGSKSGSNSSTAEEVEKSDRLRIMRMDPADLLAVSIQLDGALTAWQDDLPAHLRPDSTAPEWAFQRQRSVLLMRFLHLRLLIHRQTLLLYISRPVADQFQLQLMLPCIRRCVLAASESITQMRFLRQHNALSSLWHNSHYIFAALGVLLVFQKIDPQFRAEVRVPTSINVDELIGQGLEILQRVGGEMHPLAARYVQSFEQLRTRLKSITIKDSRLQRAEQTVEPRVGGGTASWSGSSSTDNAIPGQGHPAGGRNGYAEDVASNSGADYNSAANDVSDNPYLMPPLDDEMAMLRSVLLDGGEWNGFMDLDWQAG